MTRPYAVKWTIDDSQAIAAAKRGAAAMKDLDRQALKTASNIERALSSAGGGAAAAGGVKAATAAMTAHMRALTGAAKVAKESAAAEVGAARHATTEKARIYTQDEAQAKAHAREIQRINRQMVADAAALERAKARAVTTGGVAGGLNVTQPQRSALNDYSGVQYKAINNKLRGVYEPGDEERERISARVREIDQAIIAGKLAKATTLHRGTSLQALGLTALPKVGDVIKDKAYLSTSTRRDIAEGFHQDLMLQIHARRGARGADVSHLTGGGEAEVLLPRNQPLKVKSRTMDAQGRTVVVAEAQRTFDEQRARDDQAKILRARRDEAMSERERVRSARAEAEGAAAAKARAAAKASGTGGGGGRRTGGAGPVYGPDEPKIDVGFYKTAYAGMQAKGKATDAAMGQQAAMDAYYRRQREQTQQNVADQAKAAKQTVNAWQSAYNTQGVERAKADAKASRTAEQQAERDAAAIQKRMERTARQAESSAAGPYGRLAQVRRRDLTQEELHLAAKNKAQDAFHNKQINRILKSQYATQDSFRESIMAAAGYGRALTGVGAAMIGLEFAGRAISGISGAFREAERNADALAEKTLATVAAFKALASVAGKKPSEAYGSEVLRFGVETGLGAEHAAKFQESFLGRAQIVRGKTISDQAGKGGGPSEFDQYMLNAGKLAAAKGIPDEVAADLAGGVLKVENFKAKAQGADEATSRLMGAYKILDAGSGKMAILGPQLNKALAELTAEDKLAGVFRNAGEAAVATSVAAEHDPGEAGTMVSRTSIGLRDFGDKDKKEFFRRAAITERDSFLEAIQKANKVIGEEVARGVPVDTAIKKFGFDKEIRAERGLKTFYNARDTVLKPQLENLAATEAPGAAQKAAADLKSLTGEKTFRDAQAKALKEKAEYEVGKRATDLNIAKNRAEAFQIEHEGAKDSVFGPAGAFNRWGAWGLSGFRKDGGEVLAKRKAIEMLKKEAGETGGAAASAQTLGTVLYGDPAAEAKRLADKIEANRAAAAGAPGPQAMNEGGLFPMGGMRGMLAMSAVGVVGDRVKSARAEARRLPDTERLMTGNVYLPDEPAELARIRGLGVRKPVSDAERDRIANLGVKGSQGGRAAKSAALAEVKPVGDWMNWGSAPVEKGSAPVPTKLAYNPYDELEAGDAWPGYSPRGGKIGSMVQVDLRSNSERLMPNKPRGDDFIDSVQARAGVVPTATASTGGEASQVEKDTLAVLRNIERLLQGDKGVVAARPGLPLGAAGR